ncbi:glycosyltransferase [Leptobacterium sp. I13]|uniref:glycosyltransferase n=1 Tax=Leptobacterium meishanense TaxID=3128904 RepID=UPI0030ED7E1F
MLKRKHIDWLFVLPTDGLGGGAEQFLFNIAEHLSSKNEKCKIIILTRKKYKGWDKLEKNCQITYLPFSSVILGYLFLVLVLFRLFVTHQLDYTFTSQTLINGLLGCYKRIGLIPNTKVIVRESNSIFKLLKGKKLRLYTTAYKLGYKGVDLIICQTAYMKDQLLSVIPKLEKNAKIVVLHNPVNLGLIAEKSKKPISITLHNNTPFIVAAGRLVPAKGFDILITAFGKLRKDFPELQLIILGEGPERQKLTSQIERMRLHDRITLVGFVENVYPYFKNAALCVLSSRIEGFPNVLLQMMSQNTKVVSTLSAGDIDQIKGIYTCEIENVASLANTIKQCFNDDTTQNRALFDAYLEKRTVPSYIKNMLHNL